MYQAEDFVGLHLALDVLVSSSYGFEAFTVQDTLCCFTVDLLN